MLKLGHVDGETTIEGYKFPDNGESFSQEELAEAYVLASLDQLNEGDTVAADRVRSWVNKEELPGGDAVYCTWREGLPVDEVEVPSMKLAAKPYKTTKHEGPSAFSKKDNDRNLSPAKPYEPKANSI